MADKKTAKFLVVNLDEETILYTTNSQEKAQGISEYLREVEGTEATVCEVMTTA